MRHDAQDFSDEDDLNQISNQDLEAKIAKMRERIHNMRADDDYEDPHEDQ
jgi:hypothetical protein